MLGSPHQHPQLKVDGPFCVQLRMSPLGVTRDGQTVDTRNRTPLCSVGSGGAGVSRDGWGPGKGYLLTWI
jgi:hypothetical protein